MSNNRKYFAVLVLLAGGQLFVPGIANAYIGPGAGLSAIGTFIALVGAVLLAIVGFVWYPVKRLLRGKKQAEKRTGRDKDSDERKSTDDPSEESASS